MPVPVAVAVAGQKHVPVQLQAIGTVHAYASVSVKPRVDGQLGLVGFKQGDEVKKGHLIFQIEPRAFEVALNQAEAVLARDIASPQNAEVEMRRTDELANTKAIAATVVDENRAKVASLRGTVEADKATVEIAKVQLSYCSIHSPINGRMGLLLVDVGNVIKNNDTILAIINQFRPIYVDFAVPEQSLLEVRDAMAGHKLRVEASPPHGAKHRAAGELEVINNQVDSTTGTVLLRAKFPNDDELLWPGQFVNVTLTLGQLSNVTVVPSPAIQSSQSGEFVFVVKSDSTVEKRPITPGPMHDGEAVIQTGVKPGETVVTDGQLRLVPGSKVNTKTPEAAPPETAPTNRVSQPGKAAANARPHVAVLHEPAPIAGQIHVTGITCFCHDWFMVPMHAKRRKGAAHEPTKALVQPFVAYATKGCPDRFRVPRRVKLGVESLPEAARGRPARSMSLAGRFSEFEPAFRRAAAATETVARRLMVPMRGHRGHKTVEATHETPDWPSARRGSPAIPAHAGLENGAPLLWVHGINACPESAGEAFHGIGVAAGRLA